jgi:hypothetical protein
MAKYFSISAGACFFRSQADGNRAAAAPAIAPMSNRRGMVGLVARAHGQRVQLLNEMFERLREHDDEISI